MAPTDATKTQDRPTAEPAEPPSPLQAWRLRHHLSLQDMADLTGLSPTHLSRVERGISRLAPLTKRDVANRLQVRISELFEVEPLDLQEVDGDEAQ